MKLEDLRERLRRMVGTRPQAAAPETSKPLALDDDDFMLAMQHMRDCADCFARFTFDDENPPFECFAAFRWAQGWRYCLGCFKPAFRGSGSGPTHVCAACIGSGYKLTSP